MKLIIVAFALIFLSGCASVLSEDHYLVEIKSHPLAASYKILDSKANLIHEGVTPEIISLYAGAGHFDPAQYKVLFTKEGYHQEVRELRAELDEFYFGNITNLIGFFAVDPAGSMYELPGSVHAFLKPLPAPPVAEVTHKYVPYYRFKQPTIYRRPAVKVEPVPAPIPIPVQPVPDVIEQIVTPLSERVTTHTTEQVDTIQHSETHFDPCTDTEPCK